MSAKDDRFGAGDLMRGAWIIEVVIVTLVLLLFGKILGIAITMPALLGSLAFALIIMTCAEFLRRRVKK